MEHIGEILKRLTPINTSSKNTDTWSAAEEAKETATSSPCPICHGAGFVHPLLPSGNPDYSRVIACRCKKQEVDKERLAYLQRYSNLGALTRLTFENLNPQGRSGNPVSQKLFRPAYEAAKAFAAAPAGWLILTGPSGCGKTHLAAAIANERLRQGLPVFFINTSDLLDHLRSAFSPSSEIPYDQFFDQVRNVPLLVLDDLGLRTSTPWAKEKLDQLLNYRHSRALPTVIVVITPIELLDERIRTRLTDPQLCQAYLLEGMETSTLEYGWAPKFELQKSMTFETFHWKRVNLSEELRERGYTLPEVRQNLEEAYRLALEFAKSPDGWLVFQGNYGCGKTHLAAAIANYRYQSGKPALFLVIPEFLDHLRSTFSPESKVSYDQLFESVKNTPLLIMDDFGEQSSTPWAQEKLYQVINYRYNARLATVITTSCSLDEIESRIGSRLVDPKISTFFQILATDYRGDRLSQSTKRTPRRSRRSDRLNPQ